MKPPQIIAILLLLSGLGYVASTRDGKPAMPALDAPVAETPAPEPAPPATKRPIFSGPHDGSHIYQGVLCPACEMGPMEF